jgi:hypothetical protein
MIQNTHRPTKWISRKKYLHVPPELIQKTFYFSGTLPGVGKTFFKVYYTEQLKQAGYRVISTGTTHKATEEGDKTVSAQSQHIKGSQFIFDKLHPQTSAFYIIDEVGIMNQNEFNQLKSLYPKCCFLIFGDPLQFDPVSGGNPISEVDYCFEFNMPHRSVDIRLINFLNGLKEGIIDYDFIRNRETTNRGESLVFSYTNKTKDGWNYNEKAPQIKNYYMSKRRMAYTDTDGTEKIATSNFKNNDIWKLTEKNGDLFTMVNIRTKKIIKVSTNSEDWIFFEPSDIVNLHKIQGDTLDCGIHLILDQSPKYALKSLYVACSRVKSSDQITFHTGTADSLMEYGKYDKMISTLNQDEQLDNDDLIKEIETCYFLNTTLILINRIKVKEKSNKDNLPLGLGTNKNQQNIPNKVFPIKLQNKMALNRLRNNIDKELLNLPKETLSNKANSIFIPKNPCANHTQSTLTSFNNFVFEFDDLTGEEQLKLIEKYKKLIYRVIFSGNKSYHVWLRVNNAPQSIKEYEQLAKYLNNLLFEGKACQSCINPAQLMRAPNEVNKETGKLQEIIINKRNIIEVNLEEMNKYYTSIAKENESVLEPKNETIENEVEFYFNICKGDHDKTNGGRGELILGKTFKQLHEKGWTSSQCKELIELLCNEWGCPEKIKRLQSYF